MKRFCAALIALVLVLSLFPAAPAMAAGNDYTNTGTRHEICSALSDQAEKYYTGSNTMAQFEALPGIATGNSVEAAQSELFTALHELMRSTLKNTVTYSSLTSYWKSTDASGGSSDAILFYSDSFGTGYNREHVWPKSQGNFYESGAGSDLHHLRPTNSGVNSARSHYTMGNVKGVLPEYDTYKFDGKDVLWYDPAYSLNSDFGLVEVADGVKGDVARILLYVYVAYGQGGSDPQNLNLCTKTPASGSGNNANQGNKVIESLDTLLDWCEMDPVDTWEMSRNDCVETIQGNRNVFIDYPELGWMLFDRELPDMDTPSGYAREHQGAEYEITACADDETHGTVTRSGKTVTAQPAEGYYVSGYTLEPEDAAVVHPSGNRFRLTDVTADCVITVHFAAKTSAELRFSVPEGVDCPPISGYLSDVISLPQPQGTPAQADHDYSFVGWVTAPVEPQVERPVFLQAFEDFTLSKETQTLYALYTYTEAGGQDATGEFSLVRTMADGDYVIASPDKQVMMNNDYSKGTYMGFNAASFTGSVVTNATAGNIFSFRATGGSYAIYDCNGYPLRADGGKKVTLDPDHGTVTEQDTAYLWTVAFEGDNAILSPKAGNQGYLQYNGSAPRYTTYTSTQVGVCLYGTVSGSRVYLTLTTTEEEPEPTPAPEPTPTPDPTKPDDPDPTKPDDPTNPDQPTVPTNPEQPTVPTVPVEPTKPGLPCTGDETCPGLKQFTDMPARGNWAHNPIDWAVVNKITNGMTATTFVPGGTITRGQAVTFLWRAAGKPAPEKTETPFTDLVEGAFYYDAVLWAVEKGITNGMTATTFNPGGSCTRGQIVTFLYRFAGSPEVDTSNSPFTDLRADAFYTAPVAWAVANEVTNGMSPTTFAPDATCTRAQVVTFLYRQMTK